MNIEHITSKAEALDDRFKTGERKMAVSFRWKVKQVDSHTVEVIIPTGDGHSLINPAAAEQLRLSEAEVLRAEEKALKAILVLE